MNQFPQKDINIPKGTSAMDADVAIIGGGLAGLCLSIQLVKQGFKIILFEKESYPFHKVCGEYISMESWDFLEGLGVPLHEMDLPVINKLIVTSPDGTELKQDLSSGGFGISRYKIDNILKEIARLQGVQVIENCKAENVIFQKDNFSIITSKGDFNARVCCGSFGKKSNLDVIWKRGFTKPSSGKLDNYVGIKYHIKSEFAVDTIALHNFKNGYCGISKIEEDKYCLCYLTTAANLKENNNSIAEMEKNVLYTNPHLKNIFTTATRLYSTPLSISQISFKQKTQIQDHVLLIGDAAGMITPLCGNGMSMAMHGSKIAATYISGFLKNDFSRKDMEEKYLKNWNRTFFKRLRAGRVIQYFFGKPSTTNLFVKIMKQVPYISTGIIRQTHGKPF
ncbi:MAG: NAD(P)/FAD-dependent oxidoreductase [Ferruginibacter sp.]